METLRAALRRGRARQLCRGDVLGGPVVPGGGSPRAPLTLVFDDIHWGEATFLDLIEHRGLGEAPMLALCVARPELLDERAGWGRGTNATTVSLEPLSDDECGDLMGNLLGRAALPAEARDRMHSAAAEGTPLFVEEMLSMLIDDGSLAREATDGWRRDRWSMRGCSAIRRCWPRGSNSSPATSGR